MNKQPERSVEEIVDNLYKKYGYEKPENVADDERPYYPPYADESRVDMPLDVLDQTLQAERQKRDEMVEAEKQKWVTGKRISQFIGIDWNGQEITEKYADELELEPEEELDDLVNEISEKMAGKYAGSYSVKVVRNYQEGQMSHPETGQWDFPPYYEIDSFYYRRDGDYQSEYKPLTPPTPLTNDKTK